MSVMSVSVTEEQLVQSNIGSCIVSLLLFSQVRLT